MINSKKSTTITIKKRSSSPNLKFDKSMKINKSVNSHFTPIAHACAHK